jgi:hypothetical protein
MPVLLHPERAVAQKSPLGFWSNPAVIQENNFIHKSLSNWSFNIAIGCGHACRFCYVPSAATIKMGAKLKEYGVDDPDAEWGDYVLLRPWDERKFLASLEQAETRRAANSIVTATVPSFTVQPPTLIRYSAAAMPDYAIS